MKKFCLTSVMLIMLCKTYSQQTPVAAHPSLWVNAAQLAGIRQGIKDTTLKLPAWLLLKEKADKFLTEQVEIPPRGGNWEEFYVSPVTGNALFRGKQIGDWKWTHTDRAGHADFFGDTAAIETDYDGVIIALIHNAWALGLVQLGLAYQISRDTAYLNKARQILLAYADLYPSLPLRTRVTKRLAAQGSGKIHIQDLNESQWLVNMAEGADLIWDLLSDRERAQVTDGLLLPAAEVVMRRKSDTTNIQCWRDAAIGSVGFLIGNPKLIGWAMDDSTGFSAQVKEGFNPEGMTKDLSPGYQFFALYPLVLLAQAAHNHAYPIDISPLHKMFRLPLNMCNAQLMLPPFNDSRPIQLPDEAYLYEWAYSQFHDSSFLEILFNPKRNLQALDLGPQFAGWNLLFGSANFQAPVPHALESRKFDSSGVIVLSKGQGNENLSLFLKYANQMRNLRHFHNAQLDMAIIKGDEYVTVMPGNMNYASPLSDGWYRSGVSHNTLMFNQRGQRRSTAKCLGFGSENGIDYAVTQSTNIYNRSVRFVRTAAMLNDNLVLVIDQFRAAKSEPAIFDLCNHPGGVWEDRMPGEPWIAPDSIGYQYLINPTIKKKQQNFYLKTKLPSGRIITSDGAASTPMDLITANGQPSFNGQSSANGQPSVNNNGPVVLFRFHTDSTEAVTVAYCISSDGKRIKVVLEPNTNSDKRSFMATLNLEDGKGGRTKIVVNPDLEPIPGDDNMNPKIFAVSLSL